MWRGLFENIHSIPKNAPVLPCPGNLCVAFNHNQDHFVVAGLLARKIARTQSEK
jgi:hypothetical protein